MTSSRYRIVAPWTIGCAAAIVAAHLLADRVDLARSILDAGGSAAICGALFGVANLAVISMLIALAALIGLEERPVVRMLREAGRYPELIDRVVGCVHAGIALGTLAIGTLVAAHLVIHLASAPSPQISQLASIGPPAHPPGTPLLWALATTALSLGMGVLAQVASVAWLVARMMSFQSRSPSPSDSPEAARARLRGDPSAESGGLNEPHGR